MPTTTTPNTLLGYFPGPILSNRKGDGNNINFIDHDAVKTLCRNNIAADCRVCGDSETALKTSDGASLTIAEYEIDVAAGECVVGGYYKRFAAVNDGVILGTQTITSYGLDGGAPTALSADGKTCWFALVAIVVNGAVEMRGIFGDEADDGSEDEVTAAQINTALRAASITNHDPDVFMVLGRIKIQRVATDTINLTHTDPATDDTLGAERARGYSLAAS